MQDFADYLDSAESTREDVLLQAINEGDQEKVKYYLENYVYNMSDIVGENLYLHCAIRHQNTEITKLLLDYGATITPNTIPPFIYIYQDVLKVLLTHCDASYVNRTNYHGKTYLHLAVRAQLIDVVDLLIERGADVNAKTYKNESVIQIAFQVNNEKIIHHLLQCDIDLNSYDVLGHTPLHYAVDSLNIAFIEILLSKGANVNIRNKEGMTPLDLVIMKYEFYLKRKALELMNKISVDTKTIGSSSFKDELLFNAMNKSKLIEIAKMLLENGAEINSCCKSNEMTPLHHAVKSGNREMVAFLVHNKANINAIGAKDETPLNIAIAYEHEEIAEYLISKGAIVNNGFNNDMLLHMAVYNRNENLVSLLLKNNADVTVKYKEDGRTALHMSVAYEGSKIPEMLLEKKADINESTNTGDTALHIATRMGHAETCKLLLKYKPDLNKKNAFGQTPLYIAAERGFLNIVTELLHAKPDISENKLALYFAVGNKHEHKRIILDLVSYGFSIDFMNALSFEEITAFMSESVKNGHLGIVRCILNFGLDLNMLSSNNIHNDEHFFLHSAIKNNHLEITKLLIERGSDVNVVDEENCTPIYYAVARNNFDIVKLLLENYAIVDNDYQLFFMVISKGNYSIIQEFLKYYKSVNVKDEFGTTALHFAAWNGDEETVQLLFEKGLTCSMVDNLPQIQFTPEMRSNIQDHYGEDVLEDFRKNVVTTPLHIAARRNHSDIVEALIEQGFNVDCRDGCGRTPLHIASLFNNVGVIDVLVEFGAELKAVDESGNTCIDYAYNSSLFQSRLLLDKVFAFIHKVDVIEYETVRPSAALSLRLQMKYLAMSNSRKGIVNDQVVDSYQLQDLYSSCNIEIKKLEKINVLHNTSMYDVLTKDINTLATNLINENFYNAFERQMTNNELQVYNIILSKRIRRAKERRTLLDEAEIYFTSVLNMPDLVAFNIMSFLNNRDLRFVKQTYELFFSQFDCVKCKEA